MAGLAAGRLVGDRAGDRPGRACLLPAPSQYRAIGDRPRTEDHHANVTERATPAEQPRFLIVGAVAVGSLIGARLAKSGCGVTIVGRPLTVDALARGGRRL